MAFFISVYIKLFFIMTPFFVLSMFLSMTKDLEDTQERLLLSK